MNILTKRNAIILILLGVFSFVFLISSYYKDTNILEYDLLWYSYLLIHIVVMLSYSFLFYINNNKLKILLIISGMITQIFLVICFKYNNIYIFLLAVLFYLIIITALILNLKKLKNEYEILTKQKLQQYSNRELLPILNYNIFSNCLCLVSIIYFILPFKEYAFYSVLIIIFLSLILILIKHKKQKKYYNKNIKEKLLEILYFLFESIILLFTAIFYNVNDLGLGIFILIIIIHMSNYFIFDRKHLLCYIKNFSKEN